MRSRKSGISTIIGAIFFILVVFLVFTATIVVFQSFSSYNLTVKQVDQVAAVNQATSASISSLAFGGYYSSTGTFGLQSETNTRNQSLIPVTNMNLTGGMQSWAFNRAYEVTEHDATVENAYQNVLPGLTTFNMTVFNNDTAPTVIVSVELAVDALFSVNSSLVPAPSGWAVSVIGNTIEWKNTILSEAIYSNVTMNHLSFTWGALVPPIPGEYYHPVTLGWKVAGGVSTGSVSISTDVVTSGPGATTRYYVEAQPTDIIPGGAQGGWDPTPSDVGSPSGPGSLYFDFQPSFNGVPINGSYLINGKPSGAPEQLTAVMNFTTGFSIPWNWYPASACCTLNYGYSMDALASSPTPITSMQVYLLIPPDAAYPNGVTVLLDQLTPNEVNGIQVAYTGWTIRQTTTNLTAYGSSGRLPEGFYRLVVSVTADLFGSNQPNSEYPANIEMHFDDVGLSLPQLGTHSSCADNYPTASDEPCFTAGFPSGCGEPCALDVTLATFADQTEIRSVTFEAHLALSSSTVVPTAAVVYLADFSRGPLKPPRWVDVGVTTLSPTADLNLSLPTSSAFQFVLQNTTNGLDKDQVQARVFLLSNATSFSATVTLTVVLTTWNQVGGVLSVYNGSAFPIHLVDVFISGPGGVVNETINTWVGSGSTEQVNVSDLVWVGGQPYTATVLTDKGIVVNGVFDSP